MARICMNEACKLTATIEWKKGWDLKSGGFATLCYHCGSAYENLVFCETFHREESGWRECRLCGKRIHCGCIVSKDLHDYLDFGGIGCIRCSKKLENRSLRPIKALNGDVPNGFSPQSANNVGNPPSSSVSDRMDSFKIDKGKLIQAQVSNAAISNEKLIQLSKTMVENDGPMGKVKQEVCVATGFPDLLQQHVGPSLSAKKENPVPAALGVRDMYESKDHLALSFSLGTPFHTSNTLATSLGGGAIEEKELSKVPPFHPGQRARHIFPKSQKMGSDVNKGMVPEARVARPPAEGRGRNQLLPRYWPRITDQELQQIAGDLNSTIVPLFEKVLSASDAGRIGRLVLPKACAEAYFPPISQSEGLPIRIQDIKGKEWTFQFRFWPNNNSRMYVLEGVTPCIQNMQLQAGDTVTFSRIDPGGKLVIGFRKASNSGDMQDCQPSALSNGTGSGEASGPGINDNRPFDGGVPNENLPPRRNLIQEKKKMRNIGSKSKRLHMRSEDAIELRLTWDEAQELLRPPPSAKPNIVMIEDHVFEEYDEPPVFGKRTIFAAGASGKLEQWAQCDSCFKWRRLPVDFLVPPKWSCSENIWDPSRCSCAASGEMNPSELERFLRVSRDFKQRRISGSPIVDPEQEHGPSGLDALATAAFLGEDQGETSAGPTTRHPRHRPGCTCIVCIQPPSGKGRHKPTCICNVCLTVKRRFKTLMLRKKKRLSEREVDIGQERNRVESAPLVNSSEANGANGNIFLCKGPLDGDRSQNKVSVLDLNCDPNREEDVPEEGTCLDTCSGENEITEPSPCLGQPDAGMVEHHPLEEGQVSSMAEECENGEEHENKDEEG